MNGGRARLSRLRCCAVPGQPYGVDFCRGWLAGVNRPIFGGDEDAAELGEHVGGRRLGLGAIPGGAGPVLAGVGGVVPGGGVLEDRDALAGQGEREGAVHRRGQPVAGLACAEDLLGVFDRDFDGLIANGKFCCVRRVQMSLTWWHRPLRLRGSALQGDVVLAGEPDEPNLERVPSAQPESRRRAPVGSGLSAAGPLGRAGRPAGSDADGGGGA
jgi:hypothetical protein